MINRRNVYIEWAIIHKYVVLGSSNGKKVTKKDKSLWDLYIYCISYKTIRSKKNMERHLCISKKDESNEEKQSTHLEDRYLKKDKEIR